MLCFAIKSQRYVPPQSWSACTHKRLNSLAVRCALTTVAKVPISAVEIKLANMLAVYQNTVLGRSDENCDEHSLINNIDN